MAAEPEGTKTPTEPAVRGPYARLPEPVRLEETIATQDSGPPPDPEGGRNVEQDFVLRYAGG